MAAKKKVKKAEPMQYGYDLENICSLSSTLAGAIADAEGDIEGSWNDEIAIFEVRRIGAVKKSGATYVPDA